MNSIANLIAKIQQKPYKVRMRMLWGATAAVALILMVIWFFSVKKAVTNIDSQDLLNINRNEIPVQEAKYVKVERIEESNNSLKIFFSVNNPETDILSFSSSTEVELTTNKLTLNPVQIQDRQNKMFVQKILSKTENFGILVFSKVDSDSIKLVFKDLYFESRPDKIFSESISLNVDELKMKQELRK
ncbi:MAG: hypothetical protein HYV13_02180 [Candidatus Doudnabacteria bacterium]|nr:hypothetical protein [Candidatus Doudnabacteria bacterium]